MRRKKWMNRHDDFARMGFGAAIVGMIVAVVLVYILL